MTNTQSMVSFEKWCESDYPKWSIEKDKNGMYLSSVTRQHWIDWIKAQPKCEHGNNGYCFLCEAKNAPKCNTHNNPWYCGHCGNVTLLPEKDRV